MFDGARTSQFFPQLDEEENNILASSQIVIALIKSVNIEHVIICFDNWFTSFELLKMIRTKFKSIAIGTIQKGRIQNVPIELPNKSQRGAFEERVDEVNHLFLVKWLDNKEVLVCSNFAGVNPVQQIERYDRKKKETSYVTCPNVIKFYNMWMGGVDLADQLVAQNRTQYRTHKWDMRLFAQILDLAMTNAWTMMRRDTFAYSGQICKTYLKTFKQNLADSFVLEFPDTQKTNDLRYAI